jgi:lactoylglutathione lyase
MEESLKFYQEIVGLPLVTRHPAGPERELAFLGEEETKVELICAPNDIIGNFDGIAIGFEVESVEKMIDLLAEKGIKVASGPFQAGPNTKFFFVKDPDGMNVQFIESGH